MATVIDNSNFQTLVIESKLPVMLDFWATWCGPCKMMLPIVEGLGDKYAGRVMVGKVNVDDSSEIAGEYSIRSIPTILFFKEGKMVDRVVGAVPESILVQKLEAIL